MLLQSYLWSGDDTTALEVDALRDVLKHYSVKHLDGFAEQFQNTIAKMVEDAWLMATSEDLRYPGTEGDEATLMLRIMQVYSGWVLETGAHDAIITETFARMMNLQVSGIAALHPKVLMRVLWHKFIRPKPRRKPELPVNLSHKLSKSQA